ncbi:MAG: hypothetical protein ACKVQT_24845, partial [Burkholderiales bacterium]
KMNEARLGHGERNAPSEEVGEESWSELSGSGVENSTTRTDNAHGLTSTRAIAMNAARRT